LARAVGYDEAAAQELAAQIKTQQAIDRLFDAVSACLYRSLMHERKF
jgi:hypothetical protein